MAICSCNDYDATFSWKQHLNKHIESVHEEKEPFIFDDWGKAFSHKYKYSEWT